MKKRKRKKIDIDLNPDEIFMDSKNISNFDTQQFEGKIEKPIAKKIYVGVGISFFIFAILVSWRLFSLQIMQGQKYEERSENNRLKSIPIYPERGIIYDRNNNELVWNGPSFRIIGKDEEGRDIVLETLYDWKEALDYVSNNSDKGKLEIEPFSSRFYIDKPGFSNLLGYLGYPSKNDMESSFFPLRDIMIGKEGVEKYYEERLNGEMGMKMVEVNSAGEISSENIQKKPVAGENIVLSVDFKVQEKIFNYIESIAKERSFQGGAGVLMDVANGEVISLVTYPEYDSKIFSRGGPREKIEEFINNPGKPFLNRPISGLYSPGSIVKPFMALAALNEGTISPYKNIFSSGSISLPNPFFPDKVNIFKDWKAHGWVDMKRAIAVSSNVYFYEIGGGFEDVKGLGVTKIQDYAKRFGLGSLTGIDLFGEKPGLVLSPEWKKENEKNNPIWRIGDTYNMSIGQGAYQVTPIQMAVFVSAIANNGKIVKPHLINGEPEQIRDLNIPEEYFQIVKDGMRMAVTEGTASSLYIPNLNIAAKTGTAEIGISKKYINSWIIGFFPYENPKYAFVFLMEKGPEENSGTATYVARQVLEWMSIYTPKYFK